ncbi:hypothetical protein HDZ31DRAFT_37779, partial [Schizophyllum fasciatum]
LHNKAMKAELAKEYDRAFKLYIQAAEQYLHRSRTDQQSDKLKEQLRANARKCMERAEKIKGVVTRQSPAIVDMSTGKATPPVLTPVATNFFSEENQYYILRKGSTVNGRIYPAWDDRPAPAVSGDPFDDPDGQPTLSAAQRALDPVWVRSPYSEVPLGRQLVPEDIHQHVVTDCSLCASVAVCLERDRRFGGNLVGDAIHDFYGRFDLRLWFNGCWRRVFIDDKLPRDRSLSRLLCMSSINTASISSRSAFELLWPSILEKGYMKLMGGYDFPGSNSSIDLYALTGWIPEQIDIHSPNFVRERTWNRLKQGFDRGDCLITLGTGSREGLEWQGKSLLGAHDYPVIDLYEDGLERGFVVLDSWYEAMEEGECPESSSSMRIPWSDTLGLFDGIYANWNPAAWTSSLTFNGKWTKSAEQGTTRTKHIRLKYKHASPAGSNAEVWLLLSRHTSDTRRSSDYISLAAHEEDHEEPMTLHIASEASDLSSTGFLFSLIWLQGEYTNSLHVLDKVRLSSASEAGSLSISCSYEGNATENGFTLAAFAPQKVQISWDDTAVRPRHVAEVEGRLTVKNSGGNATYPTFMINPQYHLKLYPPNRGDPRAKSGVTISLQTSREVPVNVTVAWSQGERIYQLLESNVVASSGAYVYGMARLATSLLSGDYTVTVSAFEPGARGVYSMRLESDNVAELVPIPQEGAGMYATTVRGSWETDTAAGSPSFRRYEMNPMYSFTLKAPTRVKARLQLAKPSTSVALNLTIYSASATKTFNDHVATSGPYDDALPGVCTPEVMLRPGTYMLIPSTYNPGILCAFQIHVYASAPDLVFERVGRDG